MSKFKQYLLILLMIIPLNIFAYSDYIIAGGENIGIRVNTKGVIVVGTYDIEGVSPASKAGLLEGDIITSINDKKVNDIDDVSNFISNNSEETITIGYIRDEIEHKTALKLINNKTGLYLKDSISGIGTLTYVDPNTKNFGALGHEITNSMNGEIVDISNGSIFSSSIIGIKPSRNGNPGEKNASLNTNDIIGSIKENTNKGIFGKYYEELNINKLYKVANIDDIKIGPAKIKTVLNQNAVKEYSINILSFKETNDKTKNIIFEITDPDLLNKTGGIIQGMSGSPIIQGDNIIGAVTHVVINDPTKGYGIFITNMLEEGDN